MGEPAFEEEISAKALSRIVSPPVEIVQKFLSSGLQTTNLRENPSLSRGLARGVMEEIRSRR
jgi:hypothetical protein